MLVAWALFVGSGALEPKVLIVGGTGRIGTAAAQHLVEKGAEVTLAGRERKRGARAMKEVDAAFRELDFRNDAALRECVGEFDAVIHVAGPFYGQTPSVLAACIDAGVSVYVDVSDPPEFIDAALALESKQTSALLSAGAFPGMSNVLAVEAAAKTFADVKDLNFSYFTSGLGGSGALNLEITNIGFGTEMPRFRKGNLDTSLLPGTDLGVVDFPIVGPRKVWAWPFPEQATVPRELNITGSSVAAMGTAPDIWNVALNVLVSIIPRSWWANLAFSKALADFSQPLVQLTDAFLPETHAMRIDVSSSSSDDCTTTVLQAHESFRQCVGQSAAEFCLDLLDHPSPGIFLPEQRYRDQASRDRIISSLTSTPGTTFFEIISTPPR